MIVARPGDSPAPCSLVEFTAVDAESQSESPRPLPIERQNPARSPANLGFSFQGSSSFIAAHARGDQFIPLVKS